MSAEAKAPKKMITLQSSDGQRFQVEEAIGIQSITIKTIVEDNYSDLCLPIPEVRSEILKEIIHYWERHVPRDHLSEEEQNKWEAEMKKSDCELAESLEQEELFEFVMAANFLNSRSLLDLMSHEVAERIKNMSVEEVRQYFGIENDFTPEEEAMLRSENSWAFK